MNRLLYALFLISCGGSLFAQDGQPAQSGVEAFINTKIGPTLDQISSKVFTSISINGVDVPYVLIWLLAGAVFFTIYNGFFNIRGFGLAIQVVRGCFSNPKDAGEVSHFQALTTALSATVGLGNIAGVAIAIQLGGPGATFWMIIAGLLGMSSKMVECTLGVKYRDIDENGVVHGGPMYYLSKGLAARGLGGLGKVLAVFFAICCVGGSFGGGNMFQVNQAWQQTKNMFELSGGGFIYGVVIAGLVAVVIIGGIRSIANVTDKIVPFMCGIYVATGLVIIIADYANIPQAFMQIIDGAFTPDGIQGGAIGVLIMGFRRAAFSNEAGIGSAAIAHSAVRTNEHVSEGVVALLEPFIDTVIVCTMTALVIVITETHTVQGVQDGIALSSMAFSSVFPVFKWFLLLAVTLFAFSTMISWSYYGLQAWIYLFGKGKVNELIYKALFLTFVVIGATMTLGSVTNFSDAMIFAMAFPNVIGLYIMSGEVRRDLLSYVRRIKSGEIKRYK